MKSYTIHVELWDATADDNVRLVAAMAARGFSHLSNQASCGVDFIYQDRLSLESVLSRVRPAVLETGKRFFISVNELGGLGMEMHS